MILPDKPAHTPDDDDLDLELPGSDGEDEESGLRGEESFLPDDDADLGLDTDEKSVGLDVDAGLDDADSDLIIGGDTDDDEEEGSWLGEDEIDPVLTGEDSDDPDEEEGSAGDTEPAKDDGEDWADELALDEGAAPLGDRGEEGFGDDAAANESEIELEQLPPLDGEITAEAEDTEVDALGSDLLDEIPIAASAEDAAIEIAPGLRCARIASSRVAIETLLRIERPLAFLLVAGDAALAWDGSLLVLEPAHASASPVRPERRFGGEPRPFAIAARRDGAELLIALGTARGLLCSRDAGRTFAAMTSPVGAEWIASSLAWSQGPRGPRLFAAGPAGALWSSDDFGATWHERADERVLELSADDERSLVAVCRDDSGGGRGLVTHDGGETFTAIALPVREVERVQDLQALGDLLLCCRRAPTPQLVWRGGDATWQELSRFACAPATLLEENGVVHAYFFVQTQERALLLRRVLGDDSISGTHSSNATADAPEIVSEFANDAGTPLQLLGGHQDGLATLHIGTERGWYRVRIRPAGEDA